MDDQRADRALPCGFLELVGPATVIGHGPATELPCDGFAFGCSEIGIVDEEDGDLALQVGALEIVPLPLRRRHPIADEDQRRRRDFRGIVRADRRYVDVFGLFCGKRATRAIEAQRSRRAEAGVDQRDLLDPAAVGSGWFETERLEAGDQISDRPVFAACARRAAFERVGRERADALFDPSSIDGDLRDRCRGNARRERRAKEKRNARAQAKGR